ncbi:MAG: 5'-methylthioadenosine nucleosidase [Planctomycetaceae bacterium]|nr:5'-methylthioadenosine nucleosidase [Planctomycetaceae bacterium]
MNGTHAPGPAYAFAAPAPVPADVGIVAALSVEVGFLLDRLKDVRKYRGPRQTVIEGECGGKIVALVVAGPGRASARRGALTLLDGHRPRWVLSAGFGGGLNPALARNDIVLADEVLDPEGHRFAIDVSIPPGSPDRSIRPGRLLTVDQVVRTSAEKAALHRRFKADAVDMETSAVAALCGERAVRFLAIRVISDDARADLPAEIASLLTRSGSYRVGAALRAIWHRPSRLKDFWTLHEHAQEAADRLAAFTTGAIKRLD